MNKAFQLSFVTLFCAGSSWGHDLKNIVNPESANSEISWTEQIALLKAAAPNTDARYIFQRALLWTPGKSLKGCFVSTGASDNDSINVTINAVQELLTGTGVNIQIDFGDRDKPNACVKDEDGIYHEDVRVSFHDGCCTAYIGTTSHAKGIANLPSVFIEGPPEKHTIEHEIMHALGFHHEHQKPTSPCEFNVEVMAKAWDWSVAKVRNNVERLNGDSRKYVFSATYDPESIMKYYFNPDFLVGGTSSPCYSAENTKLSTQDWLGLKTAYPMGFDISRHKKIVSQRAIAVPMATLHAPQSFKDAIARMDQD